MLYAIRSRASSDICIQRAILDGRCGTEKALSIGSFSIEQPSKAALSLRCTRTWSDAPNAITRQHFTR
jgi:hypothetical protein